MIFQILFVISCAIAGGSADISAGAPPGFLPYQAGVYGKSANMFNPNVTEYTFLCSGAVISANAVLTTATCIDTTFYDALGFAVLVGFVDRFDPDIVYVDVGEIRKHDAYVPEDKTNDIAVLKLNEGLTLSEFVQVIGIRESAAVNVGTACTLSGWRKDLITLSPVLRYSNVTILEKTDCQYAGEAEICAGSPTEEGSVGCLLGDEGSPVSCEFFLTGLLHYKTDTCFTEPEPGVFGDVQHHSAWIKAQLAAESLSSTTSPTSATSTSTEATSTPTATSTITATSTPPASTEVTTTPTIAATSTPASTEATSTGTTKAPAPTYDPDHPTGELLGGSGTLSSSIIAIVMLAACVFLIQ